MLKVQHANGNGRHNDQRNCFRQFVMTRAASETLGKLSVELKLTCEGGKRKESKTSEEGNEGQRDF
jgi:hypothetical protein